MRTQSFEKNKNKQAWTPILAPICTCNRVTNGHLRWREVQGHYGQFVFVAIYSAHVHGSDLA